jgi:hypothetical protein
LVSLVFNVAADWKLLRGPWNKVVLREAMRQRIPESVRTRVDKMGFPVPDRKWFAQDLYEPMQDLPTSQAVRERGVYNVSAIAHDLQRHRDGHTDVTRRLFYVAQFETLIQLPESRSCAVSTWTMILFLRGTLQCIHSLQPCLEQGMSQDEETVLLHARIP